MKTRMEKYYKEEDPLQRTSKNNSLYDELYKEKQEPTSNVTVLDNIDEIDITKIKEMVDNREEYKKVRKYEDLVNFDEKPTDKASDISFDVIDDSNYDINKIIEKKRCDRCYDEDSSKMRKISNTQYNILKELDVNESIEEEEMDTDFMTQEKQIRTLINTISKDSDESTDLFANLRETKEEQTFYTGSASLEKVDFV